MQPEGDGLNPYAAPQSDVTPLGKTEPPMPRPASSKWAIAVAVFFLVGYALTMQNAIAHSTLGELKLSPIDFLDLTVRLTCLFSLLAGRAKPWGYYLSGMSLFLLLLMGVRNIWFSAIYIPEKIDFGLIAGGGAAMCLFTYLLCRFTFGLPSRRFYRVTQK